jgi:hypothetical protein
VKESSTFKARKKPSTGKSAKPIDVEMLDIMRGVGASIKESSSSFTALVGQFGQLVNLLGGGVAAAAPTTANPEANRARSSAEPTTLPNDVNEIEDD